MEIVSTSILAFGTTGTLIAAWFVYKTLKSNHDWQRREYAIDIVKEWNENTSKHWKAIEEVFPHLRDVDRTSGMVTELTKQQAKKIYTCNSDNEEYWTLRFHMVELLNYLEFISASYSEQVADHRIISRCLKDSMIKWHDILWNFIEVVEICEGYQPWQPYLDVVGEWKSVNPKCRKPTA